MRDWEGVRKTDARKFPNTGTFSMRTILRPRGVTLLSLKGAVHPGIFRAIEAWPSAAYLYIRLHWGQR